MEKETGKKIYEKEKSNFDSIISQCTQEYLKEKFDWGKEYLDMSYYTEHYILPNGLHVYLNKNNQDDRLYTCQVSLDEIEKTILSPVPLAKEYPKTYVCFVLNKGRLSNSIGLSIGYDYRWRLGEYGILFGPDSNDIDVHEIPIKENAECLFDCIKLDELPSYSELSPEEKETIKENLKALFSKIHQKDLSEKETPEETKNAFDPEDRTAELERRVEELSAENNELKKSFAEIRKIILELGKDSDIGRQMIEAFDRALNADLEPKKYDTDQDGHNMPE